jgi:hypothetical protein
VRFEICSREIPLVSRMSATRHPSRGEVAMQPSSRYIGGEGDGL